MKSILDRSFRYTPSFDTDIKKTFARIRYNREERARATTQARQELKIVSIGKGREAKGGVTSASAK